MSHTYPDAASVWPILVMSASALAGQFPEFEYHWPECREFRFMGSLGFGGKVRASGGRVFVSCYQEDETPERVATIDRTNSMLASLVAVSS